MLSCNRALELALARRWRRISNSFLFLLPLLSFLFLPPVLPVLSSFSCPLFFPPFLFPLSSLFSFPSFFPLFLLPTRCHTTPSETRLDEKSENQGQSDIYSQECAGRTLSRITITISISISMTIKPNPPRRPETNTARATKIVLQINEEIKSVGELQAVHDLDDGNHTTFGFAV